MRLVSLKKTAVVLILAIIIAIGLYLFLSSENPADLLSSYLKDDINIYLFSLLMILLPLIGAPISIFLVLVGIKFGIVMGILLTGVIMLFHLLATYYMVHSFLRLRVVRVLQKFDMKIPQLPQKGKKRLGFVFMIFPGIPYTMKNYLFALTEMPFIPYMLISWTAQFSLCIPFIVLGKGVIGMDPVILFAAIGILLLSIVGQNFIRKRYKNI